jgi:hypothetical protein
MRAGQERGGSERTPSSFLSTVAMIRWSDSHGLTVILTNAVADFQSTS